MGMGFGSLILGAVASVLIAAIGLPGTFRIFSAVMLVVLLAGTIFLRLPGENDALPTPKQKKAVAPEGLELTTREVIRRPSFMLYFIWNVCISAGGTLVINAL